MPKRDIRWIQRFSNFQKALSQLSKFFEKKQLNELEVQGLIKSFEYTYELAWNTIRDFYEYQGETNIQGSKDAFRLAFKRGLIVHGEVWMDMLSDRNLTTHTYNESTAKQVIEAITRNYYPEFIALRETLENYRQLDETNQ